MMIASLDIKRDLKMSQSASTGRDNSICRLHARVSAAGRIRR